MATKLKPTDGLGPKEISKIRSALRQVWHRSHARKLCVQRCTKNGWTYCEQCKKKTPKLKIDHIEACGDVADGNYLKRLFTPSKNLQGLCDECHKAKTKMERAKLKKKVKEDHEW